MERSTYAKRMVALFAVFFFIMFGPFLGVVFYFAMSASTVDDYRFYQASVLSAFAVVVASIGMIRQGFDSSSRDQLSDVQYFLSHIYSVCSRVREVCKSGEFNSDWIDENWSDLDSLASAVHAAKEARERVIDKHHLSATKHALRVASLSVRASLPIRALVLDYSLDNDIADNQEHVFATILKFAYLGEYSLEDLREDERLTGEDIKFIRQL
ncbi:MULTISPECIES: hypothetical protein [Marinobacter]|uniref:hypothetical protein n=1 Tax=Marinobacter TaxID=2742 RepID=UPI003B43A690|nr:hypothetical protein PBN92_16340 [Marinobacter alkaliphilus]